MRSGDGKAFGIDVCLRFWMDVVHCFVLFKREAIEEYTAMKCIV